MQSQQFYSSQVRWLIGLFFLFLLILSYSDLLPAPVWKTTTIVGYLLLIFYNYKKGLSNKVLLWVLFLACSILII